MSMSPEPLPLLFIVWIYSPSFSIGSSMIRLGKTKERPCRKAAHEMHEKWYTGAAELGRGDGMPPRVRKIERGQVTFEHTELRHDRVH